MHAARFSSVNRLLLAFLASAILFPPAQVLHAEEPAGDKPEAPAVSPEQIQAWIGQLGDEDPSTREKAANALIAAGNPAFDPVIKAKESENAEVRIQANAIEEKLIANGVEELRGLGAHLGESREREIRSIVLKDRKIDDSDLAPIARLRKLETVWFQRLPITDAALTYLEPLDKVRIVYLEKIDVTDMGMHFLRGKSRLTNLHLAGCPIGDETAKKLVADRALEYVNLSNTRLTDEGMAQLARHPSLKRLCVRDTKITGAGLRALAPLAPQLLFLDASGSKIDDAGAAELLAFTNLDFVELNRLKITDDALVHLRSLKKIKYLRLNGCEITDEGVAHLSALPVLEWLSLDGTRITSNCSNSLRDLPALRILNVPVNWSSEEVTKARSVLGMNKNGGRIDINQDPQLISH